MRTLQRLKITNFKSIREQELRLSRLNVFIGGNGSGKSNLINVFRFLKEIVAQNLSGYTQMKGGADLLLYYGRKRSPEMELDVEFGSGKTTNRYLVRLAGTDDDSLFIAKEVAYYHEKQKYSHPYDSPIATGTRESRLKAMTHLCPRQILADLESYRVYHFHDTSDTAAAKSLSDVEDNRFFRPQAENLAAFLYYLQQQTPRHLSLIQDTIRQIAPFSASSNSHRLA